MTITPLLTIMARLRDPHEGCPWDVQQNFATIAPYTIEEAYEVAEAITRGDMHELRDELGDLLLQVVFHAQMASEAGSFTFDDVVQGICEKMVRRHPHVFGSADIKTAQAQTENWEVIKERERRSKLPSHPPTSVGSSLSLTEGEGMSEAKGEDDASTYRTLSGIPLALPALMRAQKLQARAARVGFDWPEVSGVIAKIREELMEVEQAMLACHPEHREESQSDALATSQHDKKSHAHVGEEIGDLLFAVTNLARFTGHDAETALRGTNEKFTRRFAYVEDGLKAQGKAIADATLNDMGALWDEAKALEKTGA